MQTVNLVNAAFEFTAAALAWASVWHLNRDKVIHGVFWPSVALSGLWALNSIFYYGAHNDLWSAVGCSIRAAGSITWTGLAIFYKYRYITPAIMGKGSDHPDRTCLRPAAAPSEEDAGLSDLLP